MSELREIIILGMFFSLIAFILGGAAYLVFWKDGSAWWLVLAILFAGSLQVSVK